MKLVLHQVPAAKGTIRMPFLAPEAALSLVAIEKEVGKLTYSDMWRDATSSSLSRRIRINTPRPGYDPHNFGLSVDINTKITLEDRKLRYEDLLRIMKKRGWLCQRRDGEGEKPGSEQFNFFKDEPIRYIEKCTMDPTTWDSAAELRIWELHGKSFQLTIKEVQTLLSKISFYAGQLTDTNDVYSREAIMAFQRAWELPQSGIPDISLCRVLSFVAADLELGQMPSWAA